MNKTIKKDSWESPVHNELYDIVKKYLEDPKYLKILSQKYKDLELREYHNFYQDRTLLQPIIKVWLKIILNFISFQWILNKDFYFPGIWLVNSGNQKHKETYEFARDIIEILSPTRGRKKFIENVFVKNKINLEEFTNGIYHSWDNITGKKNIFVAFYSKIKLIENSIEEQLWVNLECKIIKPYKGKNSFHDIVMDNNFHKHYKNTFCNYVEENFDMSVIVYSDLIIKDLVLLIWYIENNKKEFWLE